jgi:hypothetical protein
VAVALALEATIEDGVVDVYAVPLAVDFAEKLGIYIIGIF